MSRKEWKEWLAKLKNDTQPPRPEVAEIDRLVREKIARGDPCQLDEGVYGDQEHMCAYVEEHTITPDGYGTKYFGISYVGEWRIDNDTIDKTTSFKRILISTLRMATRKPFIFLLPVLLIFKKATFSAVIMWVSELYQADLEHKEYKHLAYYCPFVRELVRVLNKLITERVEDDMKENAGRCVMALVQPLQHDNAYRFPLQDSLYEAKDVHDVFRILAERQGTAYLMPKWISIMLLLRIIMVSGTVRNFFSEFFKELNKERVKMSEAARYFNARRRGYNFGGQTYEYRKTWAEEMDKEKGHVLLGI